MPVPVSATGANGTRYKRRYLRKQTCPYPTLWGRPYRIRSRYVNLKPTQIETREPHASIKQAGLTFAVFGLNGELRGSGNKRRGGSGSVRRRSLTSFGMTNHLGVISSGSEKSFSTQKQTMILIEPLPRGDFHVASDGRVISFGETGTDSTTAIFPLSTPICLTFPL